MKPIIFLYALFFLCVCPAQAQQESDCPEKDGPYTHIVKKGEPLATISKLYNISRDNLIAWNKIRDPRQPIQVCQKILLVPRDVFMGRQMSGDSIMPQEGILSLSVSNSYKSRIDALANSLRSDYLKDTSGELIFYVSNINFTDKRWFLPETHFKNTEAEFNIYTHLLKNLDSLFRKPHLSEEGQKDMLDILAVIRRYDIKPVYANGLKIPPPMYPVYSARNEINVNIRAYDKKSGRSLPNNTIYLVEPYAIEACACKECFFDYKNYCDINNLKEFASQYYKHGTQRKHIDPGPYHIFVTQKNGRLEKIIHYEKRKITEADDGKTIRLKASGN